jgi:hypothetical protein
VDPSTLRTRGALSEEQAGSVRKHSLIGARILLRVPALREVAWVVLCHHERPDGQGYPLRLNAGEAPAEASIVAVANKKVDVASTNLPDLQQLVREGKVPRTALRVIWVSKLIPLDPVVVRKDLPASLRTAIQDSLATMKARSPQAFAEGGAFLGGFAKADDSKYQIIRDLNDAAKKLAAQK